MLGVESVRKCQYHCNKNTYWNCLVRHTFCPGLIFSVIWGTISQTQECSICVRPQVAVMLIAQRAGGEMQKWVDNAKGLVELGLVNEK